MREEHHRCRQAPSQAALTFVVLCEMGSRLIGAGVIACSVIGCSLLGCRAPEPPTVTPHAVKVVGINAGGMDLDVQLSVHNPNSFPLSAESVEGTLFVSRRLELGHGSSPEVDPIPAGGTSMVASRLHMTWAGLSSAVPLLASERIPYEFDGTVAVGGRSINVKLPFTLRGELTRSELVQAGLRGF
jgi:LEA14-like dessication related protein